MFNPAMMTVLMKVGEFLKAAMQFAEDTHDNGEVDVDSVTTLVSAITKDWHPEVNGQRVLDDPETRVAGIRFLAGLAIRFANKRIRRKHKGA